VNQDPALRASFIKGQMVRIHLLLSFFSNRVGQEETRDYIVVLDIFTETRYPLLGRGEKIVTEYPYPSVPASSFLLDVNAARRRCCKSASNAPKSSD
jgi:hypothetical protein